MDLRFTLVWCESLARAAFDFRKFRCRFRWDKNGSAVSARATPQTVKC